MPRQSIIDLRKAIEVAPEITANHREELLGLVDSLAREVATAEGAAGDPADRAKTEKLREAIAVAEAAVRRRRQEDDPEEHNMGERLSELEEKVEMVALEHPVIANVLAAIARLI